MRRADGRWGRLRLLLVALGAAAGLSLLLPSGTAASDVVLRVCPTCALRTIDAALAQAPSGAKIDVDGGVYPGGIVVDRPVQLVGEHDPVVDAGEQGSGLTITAPGVTVQGFTIRATGMSLDHEDTAILVKAGQATIAGNHIEDALFGIYLKQSNGSVVRDNVITAKSLPVDQRGDAIRAWYSNGILVENNVARNGRDVILWFSNDGVVRGNTFEGDRYGVHLMYSDRARIEQNALRGNSVGLYTMYSHDFAVLDNLITDNHGPSGMGLGLKAVDDATISGNRFVSNRIGIQVDESPSDAGAQVTITGNVFAYNGTGIAFLPNVRRNTVTGNDFIDNSESVAILGGGKLQGITWSADGRGNYWSDYAGYDANGDGIGDQPYREQQLFESLIDRNDNLRLFLYSPVVTAIDFAARAFPAVRPQTKLVDDAPLMHPVVPAGITAAPDGGLARLWLGLGSFVALIGGFVMTVQLRRPRVKTMAAPAPAAEAAAPPAARSMPPDTPAIVQVRGLSKRYGSMLAVDDAAFAVGRGQSLALWGPNGAGKTTILRCLLGTAGYTGEVLIDGLEPARDGRAVRQRIGFVPQELPVLPMTVAEMLHFIADLKHVPLEEAQESLALLGIADQTGKLVGALSGGQRQRLALALALIGDPAILLLDEPTANIDAQGRSELLELLRELRQRGKTLVFASHRPEDVLMLADQVLLIVAGVVQGQVSREGFLDHLEADSRLLLYPEHGDLSAALDQLDRLGYRAVPSGRAVAVSTRGRETGRIIGELARAGVMVDDFALERGRWNAQL